MPKGKPNSQTLASQKWNAKAGYVAKTYKLKKMWQMRLQKHVIS